MFGQRSFATLAEFKLHFEKVPALSGDACILTPLKFPYRRDFADADRAYRQVSANKARAKAPIQPQAMALKAYLLFCKGDKDTHAQREGSKARQGSKGHW